MVVLVYIVTAKLHVSADKVHGCTSLVGMLTEQCLRCV